MLEQPGKVYLVIEWDRQTDHKGQPPLTLTSVKQFEDGGEAAEVYRDASRYRGATFLYVTDESGHMDLILENERLPGHHDPTRLRNLGRPATG